MAEIEEVIDLELVPIPPDTLASGKEEIIHLIETLLHDSGQEQLLSDNKIQIQIEQTFPTDQAIVIVLTFLSGVALEAFKMVILPGLKRRFEVKQRARRRGKKDKQK
jgi:hypothetical protein